MSVKNLKWIQNIVSEFNIFLFAIIKYLKMIWYFAWNFLGIRYVLSKFYPPFEDQLFHYNKQFAGKPFSPPSFIFWIIGIYVAFFGLASQRYENRVDIIENRYSSISSLMIENDGKFIVDYISRLQNMWCQEKPNLFDPLCTLRSMLGHEKLFRYLRSKENINQFKHKFYTKFLKYNPSDKYFGLYSETIMSASPIIKTRLNELSGETTNKIFFNNEDLSKQTFFDYHFSKATLDSLILLDIGFLHSRIDTAIIPDLKWNSSISIDFYLNGRLKNCSLSNLVFANSSFQDVYFSDGTTIVGSYFVQCDLRGLDFFNFKAIDWNNVNSKFINCTMKESTLNSLNLFASDIYCDSIQIGDFSGIEIFDSNLNFSKIMNVNFESTKMNNVTFQNCYFDNCDLSNCTISNTRFINTFFSNVVLNGSLLNDVYFDSSAFSECQLENITSKSKKNPFENAVFYKSSISELKISNQEESINYPFDYKMVYATSFDPYMKEEYNKDIIDTGYNQTVAYLDKQDAIIERRDSLLDLDKYNRRKTRALNKYAFNSYVEKQILESVLLFDSLLVLQKSNSYIPMAKDTLLEKFMIDYATLENHNICFNNDSMKVTQKLSF